MAHSPGKNPHRSVSVLAIGQNYMLVLQDHSPDHPIHPGPAETRLAPSMATAGNSTEGVVSLTRPPQSAKTACSPRGPC